MIGYGKFFDAQRAAELLKAVGADALLVTKPENFRYVTGAAPGFIASWRYAATQMALLPLAGASAIIVPDIMATSVKANSPIADVRTFPVWTDGLSLRAYLESEGGTAELMERAASDDATRPQFNRPATYDKSAPLNLLKDILAERGLLNGTIAIELEFVPALEFEQLKVHLPGVKFVDGSHLLKQLRLIKAPGEVDLLREGARIAERGIELTNSELRAGLSAFVVTQIFHAAMADEARRSGRLDYEGPWSALSVGANTWSGGKSAQIEPGSIVKYDGGCSIGGYVSDIGRTYLFGEGTRHHRALHNALSDAFDAGLNTMRPGATLADVHDAVTASMRSAGYHHYNRGHYGHSIGSDIWSEEWPFIARDENVALAPGMVFSFEVPHYVDGLGGFIIEDQILITDGGYENLGRLDRRYSEL